MGPTPRLLLKIMSMSIFKVLLLLQHLLQLQPLQAPVTAESMSVSMSTTPSHTAVLTSMSIHILKSTSMGMNAKSTPVESPSKPRSMEYGTIPTTSHLHLPTITFPPHLLFRRTITNRRRRRPLSPHRNHGSKARRLRIIQGRRAVPHQRLRHQAQPHQPSIILHHPTPRPTRLRLTLSLERASWESHGIH